MGFESCHPAVNFLFFAAVIYGSVAFQHPVFLAISCLCAFAFSMKRNGKRAVIFDLCLLPLVVCFALYYSSYHHFGVTVLKQNFIGNNLTVESFVYGMVTGLRAAAVCMWLSCLFRVVSSDKVLYLFGRVSPRLSLFLTILLRFIPRIGREARKINLAQKGDHIVSAKNIYGGSYNLLAHTLPQYGISTTFVDVFDLDEVRAAVQENTKAIYIETLGNPNSDVVDIEALAKIAHENKIPLVVDNTFATPYLVRPIEYGADIVVHSATKFIGGHGTTLGGVIVDSGKFDWEGSGKFASLTEPNPSYHGISFTKAVGPAAFVTKVRAILLRDTGATLSPFNSFLLLQGLETLSLRVERHVENALKVVKYLESQPQVEKVHHPSVSEDPKQQALYAKYFPNGGGSIFTFEIKGDAQKAKDFIDNLELFSLLANVADVKSLVIHPATTTHSQCTEEELLDQGIKPNTIRLSIGTENVDDIIEDLDEAFKAVQ